MAARKRTYHDQKTLERIQTSQIINRLNANALGRLEKEMTPGQIKSAEVLLRKVVPDMSSVDHSGEVNVNHVARVPEAQPDIVTWQHKHANGQTTIQ